MRVALFEILIQPSKRLLKKWGKVGGVGCSEGIMRLLYSFTEAGVGIEMKILVSGCCEV